MRPFIAYSPISDCSTSSTTQIVQRVGVIGGGQLAWMMAGAAKRLGIALVIQTPLATDPAVSIASHTVLAPIADANATAQMARECDVITFENEFVDLEALAEVEARGVCFRPSTATLRPLLDKYEQRSHLQKLGLPIPQFLSLTHSLRAEILDGTTIGLPFGLPLVLKTRRHGYDGQGTFIIKTLAELRSTLHALPDIPMLLEEFVPFAQELAVIAARSQEGTIAVYPVVMTEQEHQVCHRVIAPAQVSLAVKSQVEAIAHSLLKHLQVVGILGIELFLTHDDTVLINEIAPRTHNSGHYTLDACETSQFEQHLRAVCGLPLGLPTMTTDRAVMVNLLGFEHAEQDYADRRQRLADIPHACVHWYGKTESRPSRKLGHVTVLLSDEDPRSPHKVAQAIEAIWYG